MCVYKSVIVISADSCVLMRGILYLGKSIFGQVLDILYKVENTSFDPERFLAIKKFREVINLLFFFLEWMAVEYEIIRFFNKDKEWYREN